mgnify:CR=1 FL=1
MDPEFLDTVSDGYLRFAIQAGRVEVGMPAFAQTLTTQAIDDLVVLIRSWAVEPNQVLPDLPVFDPDQVVFQPEGAEAAAQPRAALMRAVVEALDGRAVVEAHELLEGRQVNGKLVLIPGS